MFAFEPLQTISLVVVLAGSLLVLMGFADLAELLVSTGSERRVWDIVGGALSVFAGGFLIVRPERSLELLVWVTCAWLLCYGFVTVVSALYLRSRTKASGLSAQSVPQ